MENRTKVVAVVPTYNRRELVTECVQAILGQSAPVARVVVIDNASTDDTEGYMRERGLLADERIDYVRSETNTGSAGGFKAGIERATTHDPDWVWVNDNDAIPDSRALERLLSEASALGDPERTSLVSFQIQLKDGVMSYQLPRNFMEGIRYGLGCPRVRANPGDPGAIALDWFPFVSALLPKSAIDTVGLPLDDLFYFHEDTEYALRLHERGFRAFLVPASVVDHRKIREGWEAVDGWRRYYAYRNTIYVTRLHGHQLGRLVYAAALTRITAGGLSWAIRDFIRGKFEDARLELRGVLDGYRGKLGPMASPSSTP